MRLFKTILLLFLTVSVCTAGNCQLKSTKRFTIWKGGLCDETIILDSLGYFFKEKGCEGNSSISFGRYKISKDNIVSFHFLPFDSLKPIREIKRFKDSNDSTITITLYDRDTKPLSYAVNLEALDSSGKQHGVTADENGRVVLNKKLYKDLLIVPLLWIYGQQPSLVIGDENNIEVYMSLPGLFLAYNEISIDKANKLQLVLKKDGLYRLNRKTKVYSASK
jgi:hypothetical protein